MPDILLYSPNLQYAESIRQSADEVIKKQNIRIKDVQTHDLATKWIETRKFDGVIIDSMLSLADIKEVYELIIEVNSRAVCVAYSSSPVEAERATQLHGIGLEDLNTELELLNYLEIFGNGSERATLPILVVEDLSSPREIIEMYLEHMGYAVKSVDSGKAALEALKNDPQGFFCILTDIKMPEMNGIEFIRQVREDEQIQNIPIVVLSAYGTSQSLIDCLDAGASGFLTKPPRRADFVRELGRARRVALSMEPVRLVESGRIDLVKEYLARKGLLI